MIHHVLAGLNHLVSRNKLTILIYHQVLPEHDELRPSEPDSVKFAWQMRLLSKYFNPLGLKEAVELVQQNKLPPRSVCVTFDDGYANNLKVALPILRKYNIPATVFVASAFSHGENMWNDDIIEMFKQHSHGSMDLTAAGLGVVEFDKDDRVEWIGKTLKALKYLPLAERLKCVAQLQKDNCGSDSTALMMTPDEVRQLANAGVSIGSHTHNHPILKGMKPSQVREEITKNMHLLEEWTGRAVDTFAYPNGKPGVDYDQSTVDVLRESSFMCAVTTEWGVVTPDSDPMQLKRFTPWDNQPWRFHVRMLLNLFKTD